jgi:hypothetical protein
VKGEAGVVVDRKKIVWGVEFCLLHVEREYGMSNREEVNCGMGKSILSLAHLMNIFLVTYFALTY